MARRSLPSDIGGGDRPRRLPALFWARALARLAVRPRLWATGLAQLGRLAPRRWWARPPYLPLPDSAYVSFRLETQYGARGEPAPEDLVTYLEWCRAHRVVAAGPGRTKPTEQDGR